MATNYALCINTKCKMADTCSHALLYENRTTAEEENINVINPKVQRFTDEGKCQFYIQPRTVTIAHGMLKSTNNMPHGIYQRFSSNMQGLWNHTDFFDRRAGRKPMSPSHQQDVLNTVKQLGYAFPGSPWDEVTEEIQYFY